jgi:signal transduction histidine kinase
MSKLDASLLLVTPCEVNPIATVQHALQLHQQEFKSAGVEGFVHVASSYHDLQVGQVLLDPSRLLQVLINLLTNAIKLYVDAGSNLSSITNILIIKSTQYQVERRITLHLGASVESPGDGNENDGEYFAPRVYAKKAPSRQDADWGEGQPIYLTFAVEDTGCGLNDDEKNKLFKRFSQASPKTHVDYGV